MKKLFLPQRKGKDKQKRLESYKKAVPLFQWYSFFIVKDFHSLDEMVKFQCIYDCLFFFWRALRYFGIFLL